MAATKTHSGDINARTQDKLRASIKAAEIIKALSDHILSGLKMTNTQVRAAEILLRKVTPDLLATAISDDTGAGLPLLQIVRRTPVSSAQDRPVPTSDPAKPAAA